MKRIKFCLILTLIIINSIFIYLINKKEYLSTTDILGVYVNDELSYKIPTKDEALFQKAICDDENVKVTWDNDSWGLLINNLNKKVKCNLYFYSGPTVFDFDYTGDEQTFTVPVSGTYKLETWGAQGGYPAFITESLNGGLGGYSSGLIELSKSTKIYINVGGKGGTGNKNGSESLYGGIGGYNGGGNGGIGNTGYASSNGGGGATHISTISGLLSTLEKSKDSILIVSGGGGGYSSACVALGGSAGGFKSERGSNNFINEPNLFANNATQNSGYAFGQGSNGYNGKGGTCGCEGTAGGGGGYYGGYSYETTKQFEENANVSGAGGSGYIGNSLLTSKVMYCYNCEESNEESTKTISTTCNEETPTSNCAKRGNGYTRITLVSIDE